MQFGLLHPIVPAGELDAIDQQCAAEAFTQLHLQIAQLCHREVGSKLWPTLFDDRQMVAQQLFIHLVQSNPS